MRAAVAMHPILQLPCGWWSVGNRVNTSALQCHISKIDGTLHISYLHIHADMLTHASDATQQRHVKQS